MHEKERYYHEKVLRRGTADLGNCKPGYCDYFTISRAYFGLQNYELTAYFLELYLQHHRNHMTFIHEAETLEMLHSCQFEVGNHSKARDTLDEIIKLLPLLYSADVPEVYSNIRLFFRIASILRSYEMIDEAQQLEMAQIMAIRELNTTGSHNEELFAIEAASLAINLCHLKQYEQVPDIARTALHILLKKRNTNIGLIVKLQLVLGRAEYYNGMKTESKQHLQDLIHLIVYDHPIYTDTARIACQYLMAQFSISKACLSIIWNDLKDLGYIILMSIVSDSVDESTFSTTSYPDEHPKIFSSDLVLSDHFLDILPSELITPVTSFYAALFASATQSIMGAFYMLVYFIIGLFSISFLLRAINCILIPMKALFCCFYSSFCFFCCCCCPGYITYLVLHRTLASIKRCLHYFLGYVFRAVNRYYI